MNQHASFHPPIDIDTRRGARLNPEFTFPARVAKAKPAPRIETQDERTERLMAQLRDSEPKAKTWQLVLAWGTAFGLPFAIAAAFYVFWG